VNQTSPGETDGRLIRGLQTRELILSRAVDIASVDGLEGLSIGRLALDLDLSKSGLFAHFGSKEDLQIAVIGTAVEIFTSRVTARALKTPPGVRRVWRLAQAWLEYSKGRTFPGGCFFRAAASEFNSKPGRVRDVIAEAQRSWIDLYEQSIREARDAGELNPGTNPARLAFELDALAVLADLRSGLFDDDAPYQLASSAVLARLRDNCPDPHLLPARS